MTSSAGRRARTILSQHAEEASFLWLLRDRAVCAPHFSLRTLGILESRLEGHLDGLRVAGDAGFALCRDELGWKEPGEVFAAAVLAFESGDAARIGAVVPVATGAPELARALASALGWLPWEMARPHAEVLLAHPDALGRRAAVAAFAIQREDPKAHLERLLEDEAAPVRARALRAVGELARRDLQLASKYGLVDDDPDCRFWGAFTVTLLGDGIALDELRGAAAAGGPHAARAARLAARAMPLRESIPWQRALAADPEQARLACQVAGAIGAPALVPWLLEQMPNAELARVAGEAFTTITGIDLAYQDLEMDAPAGFEHGPSDDPDDEDVALDPDEDLPFPDPARVAGWWARSGRAFRSGERYLAGKPIASAALEEVLRGGRQRLRAAAALELALRAPGRPLFEVRARAARQRVLLGG